MNGRSEEDTSVKVAVRVRPLVEREKVTNQRSCVRLVLATNQLIIGKDKTFAFDYAFPPRSSQSEVFDTCVKPLVQCFLEGYNATVFAYGQTGSGKTHTVTGNVLDSPDEEDVGVIPRAISTFFNLLRRTSGKSYGLSVSYIEIYKEELHDLLSPETSSKDLHIREDESGNTLLSGVEEISCASEYDVLTCLRRGSAVRHTGATGMNDQSSRSHSIFTVTLEQTWMSELEVQQHIMDAVEGQQTNTMHHIIRSKFHFVDLAGSERAARTKNIGDRFKESVHINSGLLALGNVISALSDVKRRSGHVPYRDSKITRLLKDSLGGNAKTLMICCIGPADADMDESLNSLNYASRTRNITNKPIINQDAQTKKFEAMKSEIMTLRDELNRQRTLMSNIAASGQDQDNQSNRLRELEDKIGSLHSMCAQYRVASEEAYRQLIALDQAQLLSTSQNSRFKSWLGIIEHLRNSTLPTEHIDEMFSETINRLEEELKRAKHELKSDEEIFADRAKQIRSLERTAESAVNEKEMLANELSQRTLEMARLQQLLVDKELEMEHLKQKTHSNLVSRSVDVAQSLAFQSNAAEVILDTQSETGNFPRLRPSTMLPVNNKRPQSVPALEKNYASRPLSRHIHTSPAFVSADKVMQSFRARSALLQSRLEDSDVVLVKSAESSRPSSGSLEDEIASVGLPRSQHGTFKVKQGRVANLAKNQPSPAPPGKNLSAKAALALAESRDRASKLNDQLGTLQTQIRLKEQLIAQLVRTGRETDRVAQEQAEIIRALQKQKDQTAADLREVQMVLERMEADQSAATENVRLEYEQKLEAARKKMIMLKKKQAEANEKATSASKLDDLKVNLGNLKQQQANLQKRLKEEMDVKIKLEREVEKDQVKIRQLEERSQQQEKMLKQRADQLASARRRSSRAVSEIPNESDNHRQWLESEVEKISAAREQIRQMEQQLVSQQQLLEKREAMVAEKEKLHLRKLRSSQALTSELASLDNDSNLKAGRVQLETQRKALTDRLASGMVLSTVEERRLAELEEAIDAVDQALEYRQEAIGEAEAKKPVENLRQSTASVHTQLNQLSGDEARQLLGHLFDRVVELRDAESKSRLQVAETEAKLHEQARVVRTLESALQTTRMSTSVPQNMEERAQKLSQAISRDFETAKKANDELRNRIGAVTRQQLQQENVTRKSGTKILSASVAPAGSTVESVRASEATLISARNASAVQNPNELNASSTLTPVRVSRRGLRELSPSTIEARKRQQHVQQQSGSLSAADSLETPIKRH